MTLVLSSEPGVGIVKFSSGTERLPSVAEVFVEGFKIDETFGRLGTGITWQEWKNGGKKESLHSRKDDHETLELTLGPNKAPMRPPLSA